MEVFQLINGKEGKELEHPHCTEHQQLLTSQNGRHADIMCLLMKNTPPSIILPEGEKSSSLIKPLDPATNLQEIQSSEEHTELFLEYAISKIQTLGDFTGKRFRFLQQKIYKNKRESRWNL